MIVEPRVTPADVRTVLAELPGWFGIPAANEQYADAAQRLAGLSIQVSGSVGGVALLDRPFPSTVELHLLAVRPALHGQGLGRLLVEHACDRARATGASLLAVHTVGPSLEDEGYARTRRFYEAVGFRPVVEVQQLDWNGPTLVLVRPLG